jgi:hypothetical protein
MDEYAKMIAANFDQHRQQVADKATTHVWRWKSGVILFPEALCPLCNGTMRSTRIWHVDERAQRLIGAAYINRSRLIRVGRAVHPHVDGSASGPICLGDAKSATEALFLGLGMGSPYWTAPSSWYKDVFDHECSQKSKRVSRNHLSESMKLGEAARAVVVEPPQPEARLFNGGVVTVEGISAAGRSGLSLDDL